MEAEGCLEGLTQGCIGDRVKGVGRSQTVEAGSCRSWACLLSDAALTSTTQLWVTGPDAAVWVSAGFSQEEVLLGD